MATATQHASSPAVPIKQAGATPGGKGTPHVGDRRRRDGRQGHLLKDALQVVKAPPPPDGGAGAGGRPRYTIKPLEDELPFDKGFYVFIRAVQALTAANKGVIVVGLAGPSGSGKTVFSHKVQSLIPGCAILSMDDYNDASRLVDGNFDDPRLTDYDTLLDNIGALQAGKPARAPIYDFKQSRRVGYREVGVPSSRVVIVEGIYALSSRVRPLLDLRVSVTGGVHFDLVKRVLRDITRSGQQPEAIIQQISDTVYPMYKAFIEPDLKCAHLRIYNTFNPFTGFMDATYILKSDAPVTDAACRGVLEGGGGAGPLSPPAAVAGGSGASTPSRAAPPPLTCDTSETYDIYLLPPNEDPETCTSWLRMRNRDGRYSLMFEEWVVDGPFIISPRITFEVGVRVLGGLMALGYEIGTIMKRTSTTLSNGALTVKRDDIDGMGRSFVQVQGKDRAAVAAAGAALGLDNTYIPRSYIELVQLEQLTESFRTVTDDLRRRFAVGGEPLFVEDGVGTPPSSAGGSAASGGLLAGFTRTTGFAVRGVGGAGGGGDRGGDRGARGAAAAYSAPSTVRGGLLADGFDGPLLTGLADAAPGSPLPPPRAKPAAGAAATSVVAAAAAAAALPPLPPPSSLPPLLPSPPPPSDTATGHHDDASPAGSAGRDVGGGHHHHHRPPSAGTDSTVALADACVRLAAAVDALDARVHARTAWAAAVVGAAVGAAVAVAVVGRR